MRNFIHKGILAVALAVSVSACAAKDYGRPTQEDIDRWVNIATVATLIGCEEVSEAIKTDEREALKLSLSLLLSVEGGTPADIAGVLAALEQLKPSHRLLLGLALKEGWNFVPKDYRESNGVEITSTLISACIGGLGSYGT